MGADAQRLASMTNDVMSLLANKPLLSLHINIHFNLTSPSKWDVLIKLVCLVADSGFDSIQGYLDLYWKEEKGVLC